MINPYYTITTTDEANFQDFLTKLNLIEIFRPVLEEFPDVELFKGIVKFIAWGFSLDSDILNTVGNTWSKVADVIYEKTGLPYDNDKEDGIYGNVAELKSDGVRLAIEKWLQFQNDENWTQFIHYRDLRRQMLAASLDVLKKASGEVDYTAKMDCAKYSKELLQMMDEAKETFIQNNPKLKGSVEAINKATKDRTTRSPASYAVR